MTESLIDVTARAVADLAVFVETSDDDVLDPDAGVRLLESVAHGLQTLSDSDAAALADSLRQIADGYGSDRQLVLDLPEMLGFLGER